MRSNAVRWASGEVPPTASTTGKTCHLNWLIVDDEQCGILRRQHAVLPPRSCATWLRGSCDVLWREMRKQSPRIAVADRALVGRQALIGVQLGGEVRRDIGGSEGEIGAVQDVAAFGESRETWQSRRTR